NIPALADCSTHLASECCAEREIEPLCIVIAFFGHWQGYVESQWDGAEILNIDTSTNSDGRSPTVQAKVSLDRAHVQKRHAAQGLACQRKTVFCVSDQREVAADTIVLNALAGTDAAILKTSD